MAPRTDRIFVYGTLREGFSNPGRDILTVHASHVGQGRVQAALYDVGSYPALVQQASGSVLGDVYELVRQPRVALERLDRYEGTRGPDPLPYARRPVDVSLDDGREIEAWAYVWTADVHELERIEHGDYVAHVSQHEPG